MFSTTDTAIWLRRTLFYRAKPKGPNWVSSFPVNTKHLYNILYNVRPTSKTLGWRCTNVIQKFFVWWLLRNNIILGFMFEQSTVDLVIFVVQNKNKKQNKKQNRVS